MLRLYQIATARGGTSDLTTEADAPATDVTEDEVQKPDTLEERRRFFFHRRIERNRRLADLAKRTHGYVCQVCNFDFEAKYGELGRAYIEAHHKTPLSELPEDKVSLSPRDDFAVVCANCHRMIHRRGAPPRFEDFVELCEALKGAG